MNRRLPKQRCRSRTTRWPRSKTRPLLRMLRPMLNLIKKNGGKVNLFKFGGDTKKTGGTHLCHVNCEDAIVDAMVGHFGGTISGRWEPTVQGAHINKPRPCGPGKPKKEGTVTPATAAGGS